jgi:hypothetical protein
MCCSRLKLALGQQNRLRRCAGFLFDPPAFSANADLGVGLGPGDPVGEDYQRPLFRPGQPKCFRGAVEDNQLLPQEGVFGQEFGASARVVGQSASQQVRTGRLEEVAQKLVGG